ncbi:MAG TPA: SDR family oxidoreductase [Actinomycetota bacterium]|jgi:3-oxoacyl-[acyl-carrier protein] reductase
MDLGLSGKVAWVVGASSGLGRASAEALAREGAVVAVSARRTDELAETARSIEATTGARCLAVPLDVTDPEAVVSAAGTVTTELGPADVLVANAGGPQPGRFEALDDDALYTAFALTTAAFWRLAKQVVPAMQARGSGCLLFITSSSTKEVIPELMFSNMLRPAIVGMAKTLSKELGPHGIRALCVAPGRIDTPRVRALDEHLGAATGVDTATARARSEARIALGRYGEPRELGDVVAFLASDRASYMTGTNVVIDGGYLNAMDA